MPQGRQSVQKSYCMTASAARPLTPKQARFVDEYLIDLNATQAAIRAGYSARTAQQAGAENLSKPVIQAAIQAKQADRAARVELTTDYVVKKLRKIIDDDNTPTGAQVQALGLLGKHLAMFTDKVQHSGSVKTLSDEELDARLAQLRREA